MFFLEIKKILFKHKIIYLFLALLLFFILFLSLKENYSIHVPGLENKYQENFDLIFTPLQGEWDESKEKILEQIDLEQAKLEDEYSQLTWDLLNKKISEDKLYEFLNKHAEIKNEYQSCLRVIKKKIDYAKKDPKRRYVIKTDGWFFYLNDNLISFLILIFLMIMTIPIMRIEYLPEMKSIRSLSVLGHKKSFLIQLLAFIVVGEFFMLTSNLLKLLIYHLRYGLESWDAPLQSIELFEKCKWNISIGNLVFANILLQGIGVIFFCLLSAMVVSFLEKNMESFFSILILLLVPPMFFSEELQSKIPNPYTYLFSSELLKGYRFNDYFVSGKRLLFYILLSIVLMFAFLIIALKKGDYVEK